MMPMNNSGGVGMSDHAIVHGRLDALEQELARMKASGPQSARPSSARDPFAAYSSQAHAQFIPMPMMMPHMDMPAPCAAAAGGAIVPAGPAGPPGPGSREHLEMMGAHKELLNTMTRQNETHMELMKAHKDLMLIHKQTL